MFSSCYADSLRSDWETAQCSEKDKGQEFGCNKNCSVRACEQCGKGMVGM